MIEAHELVEYSFIIIYLVNTNEGKEALELFSRTRIYEMK